MRDHNLTSLRRCFPTDVTYATGYDPLSFRPSFLSCCLLSRYSLACYATLHPALSVCPSIHPSVLDHNNPIPNPHPIPPLTYCSVVLPFRSSSFFISTNWRVSISRTISLLWPFFGYMTFFPSLQPYILFLSHFLYVLLYEAEFPSSLNFLLFFFLLF